MTVYNTVMCPATGLYRSGRSVWLNKGMKVPTKCCHVAARPAVVSAAQAAQGGAGGDAIPVAYRRACRRGCGKTKAAAALGFETYYCAAHWPIDVHAPLMQDEDLAASGKPPSTTSSPATGDASPSSPPRRTAHKQRQHKRPLTVPTTEPTAAAAATATATATESHAYNLRARKRQR